MAPEHLTRRRHAARDKMSQVFTGSMPLRDGFFAKLFLG
jgi:hypothetical protein